MKRLFHRTMITIGSIGLFISFSGLMATKTEEKTAADPDETSLEQLDELITEEQHNYQHIGHVQATFEPMKRATIKTVSVLPENSGIIAWVDGNGSEQHAKFSLNDGAVTFDDDKKISDFERSRFIAYILTVFERD